MAAVHHDKPFGHSVHIFLMILTLGVWIPVWLARWQMHKTDRVREAIADVAQQLEIHAAKTPDAT
jgi:cytochrome oxidase assembly protein ShyY1